MENETCVKQIWHNFVLVTVLACLLMQAPNALSFELTNQEKAETFLGNVVGLDMARYEVKLISQMDFPADASGVSTATMLYNLKAQGSTLEVICKFRNNVLVSCNVNPLEGTPLMAQPITNAFESAKNFLDRYQSYSKASYIQPMRNMLNTVTELKPMTASSGDLKLTITTEDYLYIEWMNTPKGIHNMYNRVILAFQNGAFKMFTDSWNRYPIGSVDVNISKEQAISIAKDRAQSFSYEVGNMTISDLAFLDKPEFTQAELTMQPRENALYPHWEVILPLEKLYPGMTTSIRVTLWADTGEVISIKATGSLGFPMLEDANTPEVSPPSGAISENPNHNARKENQAGNGYIAAGIVVSVITVVAVALTLKSRKNLFPFF
ncbi:MAG: hypothetical protein N3E52_05705 [Candidatus Bathyarchaeota archaeon]|nr:hypothetical protein [Candidatus Bathyarchaeota archaeon]